MAHRVIATSSTGAIADGSQVAFSLQAKHFRNGQRPVIAVEGLATTETISFWKYVNGDWEELDDGSGTQVSFTTSYAADVFNGPGTYGYTKSATAGAITLTLDDGI